MCWVGNCLEENFCWEVACCSPAFCREGVEGTGGWFVQVQELVVLPSLRSPAACCEVGIWHTVTASSETDALHFLVVDSWAELGQLTWEDGQ